MPVIVLSIMLSLVSAALIFVSVRLILFKTAAKKIAKRLDFIISNDTNIGIDFEVSEKNLTMLTNSLNKDILKLRKLKDEYRKKDIELRESIVNISHDLRTPLTVIASYVNLIERGGSVDEKSKKALDIIKNRTAAMTALIEELFSYSLYESEQISLKLTEICLNDNLEKCLTEFYYIITQSGIIPQISITETTVKRCLDAKALERIINNILNNIVKYSDGDMSITLSEDGEMVFANTTHNLDTVAAGKLFNRFFTVENARSGTGLGLSIAKILTERMGGTINAELTDSKLYIHLKF